MIQITEELAKNGGVCPVCNHRFKPNGVGPMACETLTTVLDNLPSSHLLRYGARFHDWYYHMGLSSGCSRLEADNMMYELNEIFIDQKCKWYNAWYYRVMNLRNFLFARKFGRTFWNLEGCKNKDLK